MEPLHSHRGFTLVELMVVLAIIITLTGIVFTSQSTFNKTLELANTAYDVALTLRSAETFGIGSRATTLGTAKNTGYGLHFVKGASTFTLFADTNSPKASNCHGLPPSGDITAPDAQPGNCVYDDPGEFVQTYTLGNSVAVSALNATGIANPTSLDVVFSRPNPDAFISANDAYSSLYTTACITLSSPQGGVRYVNVASSGEITANATPCSNNNHCYNGATNYPQCNNNHCYNGATNYPQCNNNHCYNGATNYPQCNNNQCYNGATNYPQCNNNQCYNGATNYPQCNNNHWYY